MANDTLFHIVEILNLIPEILLIILYYNQILKRKFSSYFPYVLNYLLACSLLGSVSLFISNPTLQIATTFVILMSTALFLYEGSFILKLFTAIYYVLIIFISESLFVGILMLMNYGSPLVLLQSGVGRIIGMAGSKIFQFWIIVYSCRIYKSKVKSLPLNYWILIILMPILSAIILNLIFISDGSNKRNMIYYMVSVIGLLYLNFSVFNYFESYDKQIRLSVLEQVMERENENYKMLESSYNEIRHIKHDMKNQVDLLNALIENGKYSDAQLHMKKLFNTVEKTTAICYTGNSSVDAIINIKGDYAKNNNIRYIAKINMQVIDFDSVGLCRIIGNALDNAIEACERIDYEDKYICIGLTQIENKLAIEIINTSGEVDTNNMTTSKKNVTIHGIGLHSIKKTVKSMNGQMSYSYKDNLFTLRILLVN